MKILFYNLAHFRGIDGRMRGYFTIPLRYFSREKTEKAVTAYLNDLDTDIACLVEIDARQIEYIRTHTPLKCVISDNRYGVDSPLRSLPVSKNHSVAVFSKNPLGKAHFFYLKQGLKKTICCVTLPNNTCLVTVHLNVFGKKRAQQIAELAEMLRSLPHEKLIVCGDFNIFEGERELLPLTSIPQLSLLASPPTFPSFKPKHTIDRFLTSHGISVKSLEVLSASYSDHRPLLLTLPSLNPIQ